MMKRQYSFLDSMCLKADKLLKILTGNMDAQNASRENPAKNLSEPQLTEKEARQTAGLMRVNYAGEVCAQALYKGQALTAKNTTLKQTLEKSALEEIDHLYWCQSRLNDLKSSVSVLNPVWHTGAFCLGAVSGMLGDSWNLGFLQETEKQVVKHLDKHLEKLSLRDQKTRVILEKMRSDEQSHAENAQKAGARELPRPIKTLMSLSAGVMTKLSYFI